MVSQDFKVKVKLKLSLVKLSFLNQLSQVGWWPEQLKLKLKLILAIRMVDRVYAIQCGALLGNNMVLYRLIILQGSAMQHKISGIYALKY